MSQKRVIIYGGNGGLGKVCVSLLKDRNYWVCSIDLQENSDADHNIVLDPKYSWTEQENIVHVRAATVLGENKVDGVICVAGGWAGGNTADADMVKNADLMWKQSVWSSAIAATLANKHLTLTGCLVLTGAQPAIKGTPGMIGYGMAKAAVHQLTKSLALNGSGLPKDSFVAAILPVTLDTPMNRKFNPGADYSSWTSLEYVANLFDEWISEKTRPANGSLVQLITKDGKTQLICD